MTDVHELDTNLNDAWESLATLSAEQRKGVGKGNDDGILEPSYYVDVNNKEWILFFVLKNIRHDFHRYDTFLYDVAKDNYVQVCNDYQKFFDNCFMYSSHSIANSSTSGVKSASARSYVIDNDNHVIYWLILERDLEIIKNFGYKPQSIILCLDVKNWDDIKLLWKHRISSQEFPNFSHLQTYKMLIVENTIQFVLGGDYSSNLHYQFNIKTKKLKLIHKNIHSQYIDHIRYSKVLNFFENLKVGDWIDARDKWGRWWLAQILDIKDKQFDNYNNNSNNKIKSMSIKIRYYKQDTFETNNRDEEWIQVTKEECVVPQQHIVYTTKEDDTSLSSLCNCRKSCCIDDFLCTYVKEFAKIHRIGLPKSQSIRGKYLRECNALYSKPQKKMIIFGHNGSYSSNSNKDRIWSGLYYKSINVGGEYNYNYKDYQSLVSGFINRCQKSIDKIIAKDLYQMIFEYYFVANDKEWSQAIKTDKNGAFLRDKYVDYFCWNSAYVLVNHGNDIFIFGGLNGYKEYSTDIFRLNITKNVLRRLTNIKCPDYESLSGLEFELWSAVFCKKSQNVHLFIKAHVAHFVISLKTLNQASTVVVDA